MFKLGTKVPSKGRLESICPETNPISTLFHSFAPQSNCGPGGICQVYAAKSLKDDSDVSVLFYAKPQTKERTKTSKQIIINVIDLVRRDLQVLSSLQHQRVLGLLSEVCENQLSLAVAVDPVVGTLTSLRKPNCKKFIEHEVELKCGLLQLAEGLAYIHGSFKLHCNLHPDSIFIAPDHSWKIGGFYFCKNALDKSELYESRVWDKSVPPHLQPKLDYSSPERLVRKYVPKESDIFSFGALIFWLYSSGVQLIDAKDNLELYKKQVKTLRDAVESLRNKMGPTLTEAVAKMIKETPEERPTAQLLTMIKHFDDVGATCLWKLTDLHLQDVSDQCQFMHSTLCNAIAHLPEEVWSRRLIPPLQKCMNTEGTQSSCVWPVLKMVALASRNPTQLSLVPLVSQLISQASSDQPKLLCALLEHTDVLFSRMEHTVVQQYILDLCLEGLDSSNVDLNMSAFIGLGKIKSYLTVAYLRKKILPSIKRCFSKSSSSVKLEISGLVCMEQLLSVVDSLSVPLIVTLTQLVHMTEPQVAVHVAKLYQKMVLESTRLHISDEIVASRMLPNVTPSLTAEGLSDCQFDVLNDTCAELLEYIFTRRYRRCGSARDDGQALTVNGSRPQRHSIGAMGVSTIPELLITADSGSPVPSRKRTPNNHEETRRSSSPEPTLAATLDVLDSRQQYNCDRRRKSANDIFRFNPGFPRNGDKRKSVSVSNVLKYPPIQPASACSTPARRMSLVGTQKTFTNFGHNLACTLWGNSS